MNKIIAIVGMCGSGKSVATDIFKKYNFENIYFGSATFDELDRQKLPYTPENERKIREEIREKANGDKGIYAKLCEDKIRKAYKNGNVTLESMYSWSEYKYVKDWFKDDFKVLCIIADAGLRYQRLATREYRPFTLTQAKERDFAEIENLEKGGPISIADYYITNNGTKQEFEEKIESFVKEFLQN